MLPLRVDNARLSKLPSNANHNQTTRSKKKHETRMNINGGILFCYTFEFVSSRSVSDLLFRVYVFSLLCRFVEYYILTPIGRSHNYITNHLAWF